MPASKIASLLMAAALDLDRFFSVKRRRTAQRDFRDQAAIDSLSNLLLDAGAPA